jgi:hypothetical protein
MLGMKCIVQVHIVQYISLYAVRMGTHCQSKHSTTIKYMHSAPIANSRRILKQDPVPDLVPKIP